MNEQPDTLLKTAEKNVNDIVSVAIDYREPHAAMVVYDSQSELSRTLTRAYRNCLPQASFIDFEAVPDEEILAAFERLAPSDLVVLIQSMSFRLNDFRIRVELFKRSLKVIEHPHLARMKGEEPRYYIDALAYDAGYYRSVGPALKQRIDSAGSGVVHSGGEALVFDTPFESAMLNIGDYREMKNVGGQFPIGEVFTEARDLEAVNGRIRLYAFGDMTYAVNKPAQPITLVVEKGKVTEAVDSTEAFDLVLSSIREAEGVVWIRELGFGLNRAFNQDRIVADIGSYERMCGIHLSLGAKHGLYKRKTFKNETIKYHVDVFAVTESVVLDDTEVYKDGAWHV